MLQGLDVPLIDAHVHVMPERLLRAAQAHLRANLWHPRYEGSPEELIQGLTLAGVDSLVLAPTAHRRGMAQSLNYWSANVRDIFSPSIVAMATFHPDDGADIPGMVDEAFRRLGLGGAALQPQTGNFALDDPRLFPLYECLMENNQVLLVHAGRRPESNEYTGAVAFRRFMRRFPSLTVVVGSMGADEFHAFFDLCDQFEGLHLDTAFVFNQFLGGPPPLGRVLEYQDRILYGSGYPNIPFRVESAIEAVRNLHLGRAIEEKVFCTNASRVFALDLMPF